MSSYKHSHTLFLLHNDILLLGLLLVTIMVLSHEEPKRYFDDLLVTNKKRLYISYFDSVIIYLQISSCHNRV
jgi:hypothetical protein